MKKYLNNKYNNILAKGDGLAYRGNIFNFLAKEVYDDIDNFISLAKNFNLSSTLKERFLSMFDFITVNISSKILLYSLI